MRDPEHSRMKHTEEQRGPMDENEEVNEVEKHQRGSPKSFTCTQCGKSFPYKQ
ncbi:hypothetical protein PO909_027775, partial [Leuciscus waleckii]